MSHLIAKGELTQAAQLRRQVLTFLNWIGVALAGALIIAIMAPQFRSWLVLHSGSLDVGIAVFATQAAYVIISQRMSLTEGTYRANGLYARGLTLFLLFRAMEFVCMALYIFFNRFDVSLLQLAIAYLVFKGATAAAYSISARLRFREFFQSKDMVPVPFLPVLKLGVSSAMTPLGQSLFAQVSLIAASALLGPAAVITLNTVRIILGFMRQVGNVAAYAAQPLMTVARARAEEAALRRLAAFASTASWLAAGLCGVAIVVSGPDILRIWSRDVVSLPRELLSIFVAVAFIEVLLLVEIAKLMATQQHSYLSFSYAISMAAACALLPFTLSSFGILGVPVASGVALVCAAAVWFWHIRGKWNRR